jgi:anaerobic selenocysteine-containing dehydrogenase
MKINPEDARELGIENGEVVKMFNDRGYVHIKAVLSGGMPRKMLGCPRSFQASEFIEGHFQDLSTSAYNQVNANQVFNDLAVAVEKL